MYLAVVKTLDWQSRVWFNSEQESANATGHETIHRELCYRNLASSSNPGQLPSFPTKVSAATVIASIPVSNVG